jgi:hypothetical protein
VFGPLIPPPDPPPIASESAKFEAIVENLSRAWLAPTPASIPPPSESA